MASNGAIRIVAGNSNPVLAKEIGEYLQTDLTKAVVRPVADMEILVQIKENLRGAGQLLIKNT